MQREYLQRSEEYAGARVQEYYRSFNCITARGPRKKRPRNDVLPSLYVCRTLGNKRGAPCAD